MSEGLSRGGDKGSDVSKGLTFRRDRGSDKFEGLTSGAARGWGNKKERSGVPASLSTSLLPLYPKGTGLTTDD